jgi:hypothetical protein
VTPKSKKSPHYPALIRLVPGTGARIVITNHD